LVLLLIIRNRSFGRFFAIEKALTGRMLHRPVLMYTILLYKLWFDQINCSWRSGTCWQYGVSKWYEIVKSLGTPVLHRPFCLDKRIVEKWADNYHPTRRCWDLISNLINVVHLHIATSCAHFEVQMPMFFTSLEFSPMIISFLYNDKKLLTLCNTVVDGVLCQCLSAGLARNGSAL